MTLKVDRIENQAGSAGVPTDTVIEGSAKSWINFNGTGIIATRDSFNVTSLVDNGTGNYTVNLVNSMANTNYCGLSDGTLSDTTGQVYDQTHLITKVVGSFRAESGVYSTGAVLSDFVHMNAAVIGDLA